MRIIAKRRSAYVLRLQTGEELIGALQDFARKEKLRGAWFWAIGAADDIELAFYDLKKKKYISRRFRGRFEIVNVAGNIAIKGKDIIVHAHGVFSRPNYSTVGGHVIHCLVSATCEIYLRRLPALQRRHDPKTGLHLL